MDLSKEKAGLESAGEFVTREVGALGSLLYAIRRPFARITAGLLLVVAAWAVAPALGLLAAAGATALYGFEVIR